MSHIVCEVHGSSSMIINQLKWEQACLRTYLAWPARQVSAQNAADLAPWTAIRVNDCVIWHHRHHHLLADLEQSLDGYVHVDDVYLDVILVWLQHLTLLVVDILAHVHTPAVESVMCGVCGCDISVWQWRGQAQEREHQHCCEKLLISNDKTVTVIILLNNDKSWLFEQETSSLLLCSTWCDDGNAGCDPWCGACARHFLFFLQIIN